MTTYKNVLPVCEMTAFLVFRIACFQYWNIETKPTDYAFNRFNKIQQKASISFFRFTGLPVVFMVLIGLGVGFLFWGKGIHFLTPRLDKSTAVITIFNSESIPKNHRKRDETWKRRDRKYSSWIGPGSTSKGMGLLGRLLTNVSRISLQLFGDDLTKTGWLLALLCLSSWSRFPFLITASLPSVIIDVQDVYPYY